MYISKGKIKILSMLSKYSNEYLPSETAEGRCNLIDTYLQNAPRGDPPVIIKL